MTIGLRRSIGIGVVALALAATPVLAVAAAVHPHWFPGPVARLAKHTLNTPDPVTTAPINVRAMRRAGDLLPDDATYAILARVQPQLRHDLVGVARLFFVPAVQMADWTRAGWVLLYRAPRPRDLRAAREYRLTPKIILVELAR